MFALECQLMRKSGNSISVQLTETITTTTADTLQSLQPDCFCWAQIQQKNFAHFVEEMKRNVSKCAKDVTNTTENTSTDTDTDTDR